MKPKTVSLLISSVKNHSFLYQEKKPYWLLTLHLADGLVNVAFELLGDTESLRHER